MQSVPRKSGDLEPKRPRASIKERLTPGGQRVRKFLRARRKAIIPLIAIGLLLLIGVSGYVYLSSGVQSQNADNAKFQNQLRTEGYEVVPVQQVECTLHTDYNNGTEFITHLNPAIKTIYAIPDDGYEQQAASGACIGVTVT